MVFFFHIGLRISYRHRTLNSVMRCNQVHLRKYFLKHDFEVLVLHLSISIFCFVILSLHKTFYFVILSLTVVTFPIVCGIRATVAHLKNEKIKKKICIWEKKTDSNNNKNIECE